MKKRILSLALVLVMVFSLMPTSAFAIGNTTIAKQPQDVTVYAGENATFDITAYNSKSTALKYIWFDANKVDTSKVKITFGVNDFLNIFAQGKKGEGPVLQLTNVQESVDIQCVVYWVRSVVGSTSVIADAELSNIVKLTVDQQPACASHSLATNLTKIDAVEATCAHSGNTEYYLCNVCNRYFADAEGIVKTTPAACVLPRLTTHKMPLAYHEPTPGTCDDRSIAEYWYCDECGQLFADEAGTSTTTMVQLKLKGEKDPNNHVAVEHVLAKDGTCDAKGNVEYWFCDDCNTYFKDEALSATYKDKDATETNKNPANHANGLKEIPAVEATCTQNGNKQCWYCDDCNTYFRNAEGTVKYDKKSDTEIKALGHEYTWIDNGDGTHTQMCDRCHTGSASAHVVGTAATCTTKAVCRICGLEYGSVDANNHVNTELRNEEQATINSAGYSGDVWCKDCGMFISAGEVVPKLCKHTEDASRDEVVEHHEAIDATCTECAKPHAGNIEYWYCTECGKYWSDENLSREITKDETVIPVQEHYIKTIVKDIPNVLVVEWKYDKVGHQQQCKFCGYEFIDTYSTHSIVDQAPATCCTGHVCIVCGYDDGARDENNHVGGTEVVGKTEPTILKPGYTGDVKCLGCGAIITEGRQYKTPCTNGCAGKLEYVPAIEKTCYDDGVKAHYKCSKCWNLYMDENAATPATDADLVEPCTGHDLHPGKDALTPEGLAKLLKSSGAISGSINSDKLTAAIVGWINGEGPGSIGIGAPSIDEIIANIKLSDIDHCYDETNHWLGCQRCKKTLEELSDELKIDGININSKIAELGKREAHYGGMATCQEQAACEDCGERYGELAPHRFNEDNKCTTNGCDVQLEGCAAPTLKAGNYIMSGKIGLAWNAVEDADHYQILRSSTPTGKFTKYAETKETEYMDNNAAVGAKYYYQVRAIGNNGSYGAKSDAQSATCRCAQPQVTATNKISTGKIVLKWDAVDGATKYEVLRYDSATATFKLLKAVTGTTLTNTSTEPGHIYYYKVKAIGATSASNSYESESVSRVCKCAQPVVTVSNKASTGKIVLKWDAVEKAVKYEVYRATSSDGTYTKLTTTTGTSITNTSAVAGKTYYYKVKAIYSTSDDRANSAYSAVVKRCCDCAQPVVKIALSSGHPKLSWTAVTGADKYVIYRATSKSGTYTKLYTTTGTSFTNTSAKAGTTYYYKVVSVSNLSSSANSAYSAIVSIKAK